MHSMYSGGDLRYRCYAKAVPAKLLWWLRQANRKDCSLDADCMKQQRVRRDTAGLDTVNRMHAYLHS